MNVVRVSVVLFVCLMIPAMMMGQSHSTTSSQATMTGSAQQDRAPRGVVIVVACEAGKSRVVPGKAMARPGDKLIFIFKSRNAMVFFPEAEVLFGTSQRVFTPDEGGQLQLQLSESTSMRSALGTKAGQVLVVEFPYAVYCSDTREFAEGGSAPVIIIEDARY
jgi:hypothetical protein